MTKTCDRGGSEMCWSSAQGTHWCERCRDDAEEPAPCDRCGSDEYPVTDDVPGFVGDRYLLICEECRSRLLRAEAKLS